MSASTTAPTSSAEPIYKVGTLTYTQTGLFIVFFWLMWNDFSLMLIEKVNSLSGFLMKDLGASLTEISLIETFGLIGLWINPVFSVWSDRTRSKLGRRRPFLFITTPIFAFFLIIIPFMPDLYHYLLQFPWWAGVFNHFDMTSPVLLIVVASIIMGMFNSMVLTLFSYLYWDVVPEIVLGRFTAITKIAAALAAAVWNFFLFGLGEHHMKGVFIGVSSFCLVVYLISVWQIKEGEYPPPDVHKKGGILAPVRAYFVECFSDSYYLWIFAGFLLIQIGNKGNSYQGFYLHYDLKMDLDSIGKMQGIPQLVIAVLGFAVGTLADRLKPIGLMAPTFFLWGLTNVGSYFFVHDKWSYLLWTSLSNFVIFANGVLYGALIIEIFPREKLGQFCSANATTTAVICGILNTPIAKFFDIIQYNRFSFLWSAIFQFLGALVFIKVYFNWKARHGKIPVPHAG